MPIRRFRKKSSSYRKSKRSYSSYTRKTKVGRKAKAASFSRYRRKKAPLYRSMIKTAGIAPQLKTKLIYSDTVAVAAESGTYQEYIFALNSIYDPDVTSVGHQPRARDQFASLGYLKYIVRGIKVELDFYPGDSSGAASYSTNMIVGSLAGLMSSDSMMSSYNDLLEMPYNPLIQYRRMDRAPSTASQARASHKIMRKSYSIRKLATTLSHSNYAATTGYDWPQDYTAAYNGNPANEMYLTLFAASLPMDGVTRTLPYVYCTVRLTYYVTWMNPTYPGQS